MQVKMGVGWMAHMIIHKVVAGGKNGTTVTVNRIPKKFCNNKQWLKFHEILGKNSNKHSIHIYTCTQ